MERQQLCAWFWQTVGSLLFCYSVYQTSACDVSLSTFWRSFKDYVIIQPQIAERNQNSERSLPLHAIKHWVTRIIFHTCTSRTDIAALVSEKEWHPSNCERHCNWGHQIEDPVCCEMHQWSTCMCWIQRQTRNSHHLRALQCALWCSQLWNGGRPRMGLLHYNTLNSI